MIDKMKRYGEGAFLKHFCLSLDLGARPELIQYNSNLIYDCGDSIIRLTPNSFRSQEEVIRELHWMKFVGTRTRDVVGVLGENATGISQLEFDSEQFTVTRLEKIIGNPVTAEQWHASHFERLGALTGFLHRIGQDYRAPANYELTEWNRAPEVCLAEMLPDDERGLPELNRRVFEYMVEMPCAAARYGPIHYDIHSGNYLITANNRLVLFDFENSCRGHHINDIAVALFYARLHKFSNADAHFHRNFLDAFWKGYVTAYPIPTTDIDHIAWLLLNRGLLVLGYLYKIWPGEKTTNQNQYIARVEQSIFSARQELAL